MIMISFDPVIGMPLVHIATGTQFRVLCSCPSSKPLTHTRRYIMRNPQDYRVPTQEELTHVDN